MKKIRLVCGKDELVTTFEQAQAILQVQAGMLGRGSKWQLDDPNYEFKDNGIIKRANTESYKNQTASEGNKQRRPAPKKTKVSHTDSANKG